MSDTTQTQDPWATAPADTGAAPANDAAANAGDAWSSAPPPATHDAAASGADWLSSAPAQPEHFSLLDPFHKAWVPFDTWVTQGIDWLVLHFRPLFQGIRVPVDMILSGFQQLLLGMPAPIAILVFSLLAWQVSGLGMGAATLLSLVAIGAIGAWSQAMVTLALVLQRTKVISPITGYVSRRSVQVGAQIAAGSPLMAVVPADHIWVDANFKETQIANMRIGQPATVVSDVYGDDVVYQGKVAGIDMGTGSAFSLLPAQNATGNWIKVVQRLPVRIELDAKQVADHPLRIGLSTLVTVDTANLDGRVLADVVRDKPLYQSDALALNLAPVNQLIADVIHANAG